MQDVAIAVFALSAILVVYTIIGYPLVLALLTATCRPEASRVEGTSPAVTVLLAVHNGEAWIARKLESLLALDYPQDRLRILVLDDGSTDDTPRLVQAVTDARVELVSLPRGGKARALNAGLALAESEVLFFTDVRQTLHPHGLRRLVAHFDDPSVGVASGELVIQDADRQEEVVGLYWRYEKWIRRHQSALDAMTGATGCIYAMRRGLAHPLPADMLVDDMYLPLSAWLRGHRIVFEPEAKAYDYGSTPAEEFRRKVRTLAGNVQIVRALPGLLSGSARPRFHFVSHKLIRLALPWAVLLVGLSSLWLPSPARDVMLAAQAVCYALAALDVVIPASSSMKRVSAAPRTFVVLLAAAAWATLLALAGRGAQWRPSNIGTSRPAHTRTDRLRHTLPAVR